MRIKIMVLTLILLALGSTGWALTSHKEFSSLKLRECNMCHEEGKGVAPSHGSMWVREHREIATRKPNNCEDCHQQSFCLDCHTGGGLDRDLHTPNSGVDYMPKSHRSDWREIHPIKALDDPRTCYRCHESRSFCSSCHQKFNPNDLRVLSHRKGWSNLRTGTLGPQHSSFNTAQCPTCHPNSLVPSHQWSREHSMEARKNLGSCQSCHPDGDVCLKCHSAVSGLRVNPHPRGWDKISGKLKSAGNSRSCNKCHNNQ